MRQPAPKATRTAATAARMRASSSTVAVVIAPQDGREAVAHRGVGGVAVAVLEFVGVVHEVVEFPLARLELDVLPLARAHTPRGSSVALARRVNGR